ncbi:hypothetical protein BG003_009561 [Podila horticola]|nr:hypothetical protein BG003_009561 [Podila horticola]
MPYTDDNSIHAGILMVSMKSLESMVEVYQAQRTDRASGSTVVNTANAPPIRTVTNLQDCKSAATSGHVDINSSNNAASSLSDKVAVLLQTVVLFLITKLLLTLALTREILVDLIENKPQPDNNEQD